jgi:phosphotransferase system IIA component
VHNRDVIANQAIEILIRIGYEECYFSGANFHNLASKKKKKVQKVQRVFFKKEKKSPSHHII